MTVTQKLLKVFLVDKQLRGLQSRLRTAEKYYAEQTSGLTQLETKLSGLEGQIRQMTAVGAERQSEVARLDEKLKTVRDRMDASQKHKEYKGFLTELNDLKEARDKAETEALEQMTKADELKKQLAEIQAQRDEKAKIAKVAQEDRDRRAAEIKDRLEELQKERNALTADIPKEALHAFELLVRARGDEAMAKIEIQDRKRHEYNCSSCNMSIPIETISSVLGSGRLTKCVSCQCILYVTDEDAKMLQEPEGKPGKKSKVKSE
ncbi:MAG: hypothetical protein AMXMBFR58_25150 [Phycisphaerae bacterium]|nr:hypothetical protein [Phycisphaerales bacterium]MCK6478235.1 hypothetical protein [Phycisphaerales bacterium]